MNVATARTTVPRMTRCIDVCRRVRWDIDADVIRAGDFDHGCTFLPTGLSLGSIVSER